MQATIEDIERLLQEIKDKQYTVVGMAHDLLAQCEESGNESAPLLELCRQTSAGIAKTRYAQDALMAERERNTHP